MPTKVTDRFGQMVRYLNRIFLPSSPLYTTPDTILEELRLVQPALPASLVYERVAYQTGLTVNPATQLFFPSTTGLESFGATQAGVPFGEYYWVMAARFEQSVAASAGTGRAWIALKNIAATPELAMASTHFSSTSLTDFCDTHVGVASGGLTNTIQGGGGGPFVVPPGYTVHFSTAAVPAATTVYLATIVYARLAIGELHP